MQIAAIDRHTSADLVVERIASVIKDRKLAAGARLPGEHELVEKLKVSRPILREALARTTPSQRENQLGRRLHNAILRAVREHDPDAAADAMQQHMQAVLDRLARDAS